MNARFPKFPRRFLVSCLAVSSVFLCFLLCVNRAIPAETAPRPNIVFVLVDDLRWDALSCMGHPIAKTPNIDRLAKEGALFRNFFVSIPLCSPSTGSFFLGHYS